MRPAGEPDFRPADLGKRISEAFNGFSLAANLAGANIKGGEAHPFVSPGGIIGNSQPLFLTSADDD
jgi:hypothetical protein